MKCKSLFFLFVLTILSYVAQAQEVIFSAEASANTIGIEDQVQVTYTIQNIDGGNMQEPVFPGFRVLAGPMRSSSTQMSYNGNQRVVNRSTSFTYVLQANQVGTFKIAPLTAQNASGQKYQSNALQIKVVKGSLMAEQRARQAQNAQDPFAGFDAFFDDPFFQGADPFAAIRQQQAQMQQLLQQLQQAQQQGLSSANQLPTVQQKDLGKNVFIRVQVDKTKLRVGEQLTVTYKMYSRLPMQAQISKLPSLNGFWTQDFELPKEQNPVQENFEGATYNTFILKKSALFPQQSGNLLLDPAEITGVARIADPHSPFGKDVQFKIKSSPQIIKVEALPLKDQPEYYGAAVGTQFKIKAQLDTPEISTDGTANILLDLSGIGNIKLIQAPQLKLPNGLESFDPEIRDTITGKGTLISGHKYIKYAISANAAGDYKIEPIAFAYFDNTSNSYKTLYTQAFQLHVKQGKNISSSKQLATPTDILPLKKLDLEKSPTNTFYIYQWQYWIIYLVLLSLLILILLKARKAQYEQANVKLIKRKTANKVALKRLKTAAALMQQNNSGAFYEEISKAIWLYLSDKLNIPLSQLSEDYTLDILSTKGLDEHLCKRLKHTVQECSLALYAPSNAAQQMPKIYEESVSLISDLEEKLKRK